MELSSLSQRQQEAVEGTETGDLLGDLPGRGGIPYVEEPHEEAVAVLMVMKRVPSWGLGGGIRGTGGGLEIEQPTSRSLGRCPLEQWVGETAFQAKGRVSEAREPAWRLLSRGGRPLEMPRRGCRWTGWG